MNGRDQALAIFQAALQAADPYTAVSNQLDRILSLYTAGRYGKLYAVAFGKAAASMMRAVTDKAEDLLTGGMVITKYGHARTFRLPDMIEVYEAGHPLPDQQGVAATRRAVAVLQKADAATLVLCLISGGGSALFVAPCAGVTLEEKQHVTALLMRAGADIVELNTVRKHLSLVKGGRLAEIAHPARVISLILSDVIGDPLDTIASGPTAPDASTFGDAVAVLKKYHLLEKIPETVKAVLIDGVRGLITETLKKDSLVWQAVENCIVGSNAKATSAAVSYAQGQGYETVLLASDLQGEARDVGGKLAARALEALKESRADHKKRCLVAGGETTVTVKGKGRGGRNTEMALAFALEIAGSDGMTMLSAGTDGTDGPTDAAGAVVDGKTIPQAATIGLDAGAYLEDNDSYSFFHKTGGLVMTGPTGTNVMDVEVVLIDA
jgi:glycerate 2-kinase